MSGLVKERSTDGGEAESAVVRGSGANSPMRMPNPGLLEGDNSLASQNASQGSMSLGSMSLGSMSLLESRARRAGLVRPGSMPFVPHPSG